jgi:hypothetical protein
MTERPILTGVVVGVHGANVWIESDGVDFYGARRDLTASASNPFIGMKVEFTPQRIPTARAPLATDIREVAK